MKDRFWQIDAWRGMAIVGMIIYHFLVDIELLFDVPIGVFKMPVVLLARGVATLFIFLAGVSATIKFKKNKDKGTKNIIFSFTKKAGVILFWAGMITAVTYFMFPKDYIFFGILHFMAVSTILIIPLLYWKNSYLLIALGLTIIGLNLVMQKIIVLNFSSLDYFPLIPWFGVVIFGIVAGRVIVFDKSNKRNLLTIIGQKSLMIYLLHQPILWGGLWMIKKLILQK